MSGRPSLPALDRRLLETHSSTGIDNISVRSWSKSRIQETELRLLLFATPAYAQMVNSDENHEVALLEVQKGSLSLKELTLDQIRDLMSR